jgi:imidazolonepropionase-like amidohydrolase
MNKRFLFLSFVLFFLLFLFAFHGIQISALSSPTIALTNGTLIDGTGGPLLFQAVVIIEKGLIADIGDQNKIRIPADATIIDLKGSTLLPGFINAHVHHGYSNFNLNAWAKSGVTTVRDLGGNPRNDLFAFRDAAMRNPQNARLIAAGPMVTVPKGYPMVPWGAPTGLPVRSPDDARNKVSRLLDEGADVIKIALEGGKSFNRKIPKLSNEEAAAIVAVAHQRGTVVSAHVLVSGDLEIALNAGVDDIAHMVWNDLNDSLIERMIDEGVYWAPTLELWYAVNPSLGKAASQNLRRFVKAGGKVALGTDYDGYDSEFDLGMPIREIRWMQAAGMTPMQIIIAATKNAAFVCNLENQIGTIEKGKSADLLIVNGDPLADINVLLKKRMVINRGEIIYKRK